MASRKIAVVSPSQLEQVQETFIRAHAALIPNTLFLYGGKLPYYAEGNEKVIRFTMLSRLIFKVKKALGFIGDMTYHQTEVALYLKKHKVDAILAEYGDTGAELLPVAKSLNLDLFVHFHGADISMHHILEKYGTAYKEMFAYSKAIFSVSDPMTSKMIELGCPKEKIVKNVYGPNNSYFDIEIDYSLNNLVALGGFVDQKAPYFTIMAFQKVLEVLPDAKLIFGGTGALFNTCVNLAKYLQIENSIEFVGFVYPKDVPELFKKGSVFVQHSMTALKGDTEGTPVAIMEAMASGMSVISTYHAGIPGVIENGLNGYLVQEGDVDSMAQYMIQLLKSPQERETLGKNARELVKEKYTMNMHINRIIDSINSKN